MANPYSPASLDLGLGDGNALSQQVDPAEEQRRKKLMKLGGPQMETVSNPMWLAAMSLLGTSGGQ